MGWLAERLRGGVLLLALLVTGSAAAGQLPAAAKDREGYATPESCQGCHAEQAGQWQHSDHAWALREAKAGNVLGNFDDVRFDQDGVKARFYRKGDGYYVNIEGEDGKPADLRILYTFGHQPLQQYLVALSRGRLQALTLAWDSRPPAQGGQRWFSLYPGQRFTPDDPLHWTGRYQNWNAMCADCHSTRLLKHYDDQQDSFASTWQEPTVGCQGCHGPGQAHVDWARAETAGSQPGKGLVVDFKALGSKGQVEQCAFCHSRRQTLGNGQTPGHPQLDQSLPVTLRSGLYHGDGQIDGEVYEFGSFTQSRMYAAGVGCTDCHNPHTTKVRIEGNGLCLQCHNTQPNTARFAGLQAKDYDSPAHHHHAAGSPGAQCVSCHMPSKTYMVVDPRRDHSLRIPRPDLAAQTASPDACTACHTDRAPAWAASAIGQWYATPKRPAHYGQALQGVREDPGTAMSRLGYLLADKVNPAIVRATAADQLADLGPGTVSNLRWALQDADPLIRAYAVAGFTSLPAEERLKPLLPLLADPSLAVRDETVRAMADMAPSQLPEADQATFKALLADYEQRLRGNADLPGGRLNLAVLLSRQGRDEEAMAQYRQALRMDPYFVPARVNLVTLASAANRPAEAETLLREGAALDKMPPTDRGNLAYMLALLLVEHGRNEEGLDWMAQAATALPGNARIRYNQGLLLSRLNRRDEALRALREGLEQSPDDADLLYSLIYLHALAGERDQAFGYVQRMRQTAPEDPRLQAIEPYWRQAQ
ncbi:MULTISPECIES: tetratricopeptide repeat protein [Pseudomonas]|uniref:tetratricopeptide repeat protein n=2 Tax=Gammaproteobacteria TaxID=1236 RepID=UPI001E2A8D88|nr:MULTISPECIES: tetratricopeptide repeat protein [Pseudomonas]MCE1118611.1 tetratricopeptide repeat protein [Pseudomonas sp. NMI795_08]